MLQFVMSVNKSGNMEPLKAKYVYHINPYLIWIEEDVGVKLIGLYGLIPTSNEGEEFEWPKATADFLTQVFSDSENMLLFKLRYSVEGKAWCGKHSYGDICVKLRSSGEMVNIAKLLEKKGFAMRKPAHFDDVVVKQLMKFQLTKSQIKKVSRAIAEVDDIDDNNSERRSDDSKVEDSFKINSKRTSSKMVTTTNDSEFSIGNNIYQPHKATEQFTNMINIKAMKNSSQTKQSSILKNCEVAKTMPSNQYAKFQDDPSKTATVPKANDKTDGISVTSPGNSGCFTRTPKKLNPSKVVVMPAGMSLESFTMVNTEPTTCVDTAGDKRKVLNMAPNSNENNNDLSNFDKIDKSNPVKTTSRVKNEAPVVEHKKVIEQKIFVNLPDKIKNLMKEPQRLSNPHDKIMPHSKKEKTVTGTTSQNSINKSKACEESSLILGVIEPNFMVHKKQGSLCKPYMSLNDAPFSEKIRRGLISLNIKCPMPTQQVVWPYVMQGDSVFLVEGKRTGKLMSYIPPICDQLLDDDVYHDLPRTHGPVCLILCADSHSVCKIRDLCMALLDNSVKKVTVLAILPTVNNNENITLLFNGCDILISTPFCISRMLEDDFSHTRDSIDFRRLVHLLIDNVDILEKKCPSELKKVHSKCLLTLKKRIHKEIHLQTIAVSTAWCQLLDYLVKSSHRSVVCIGYNHECVLYSGTSVNFRIIENYAKAKTAVEILGMKPLRNTVIVCNNENEVLDLVSLLKTLNYPFLYCHSSTSFDQINDIRLAWKRMCKDATVMICCDYNLHFLNITNAYFLIHYSLPETFKQFSYRFSLLNTNYSSIFQDNFDKKTTEVEIFLDEKNTNQLPKVVNFMKRCNMEVSVDVEKIAEEIILARNISYAKKNIPLCKELTNFGSCFDQWSCKYRHVIEPAIDNPPEWMPKLGWIVFKIIQIHSLTHFTARITEHITPLGETHKMPHNEFSLAMSLWSHYAKDKRYVGEVKINDICGLELRKNHYVRCKILTIEDKEKRTPAFATVNLIDEGKIKRVQLSELLYLPTNFKEVNMHTVEIRLSGFVPIDQDTLFPNYAKDELIKEMRTLSKPSYRGSVQLTLGNIIWIDKFQCINVLSCGTTVVIRHFTSFIISNNFATANPNHMPKLYSLCNKFKFELPERPRASTNTKRRVILPTPQWAYLEPDQLTPVSFSYGITPQQFYLNIIKWEDRVAHLSQDISRYIENIDFGDSIDVFVGDYCLAKYSSDGLFYRARVDGIVSNKSNILSATSDENKERQPLTPNMNYNCFFVDHGDQFVVSYLDIRPINERLITQLPFQAIECRLIGVKPFGNIWSEMSINCLDNLCFESGRTSKYLHAQYFLKEEAKSTNGNKYAVVLVDTTSEKEMTINCIFLDANMGQCNEEEYGFIKHFKLNLKNIKANTSGQVDCSASGEGNDIQIDYDSDNWDVQFDEADWLALKNQSKEQTQGPRMIMEKPNQEENIPILSTVEDDGHYKENCNESQASSANNNLSNNDDDFEVRQLNRKVPLINWNQDVKQVTLKIQLTGVEDYILKIHSKGLHFVTSLRGDEYELNLNLYGAVCKNTSSHEAKGLYVLVKLTKLLSKKWAFLTTDEFKPKYIIHDCVLSISDDDESDVELKGKLGDLLNYYDYDSDNSDVPSITNDELCLD